VGDRVRFESGDFAKDDLGLGWDVVLLFNVIRVMPEEGAVTLLRKIAASMSEGALLVVMDQLTARPGSRFIRANQRLIDLELFAFSPGEVYRSDQVSAWIEAVGFGRPRFVPLRRSNGQGLLIARR
jgi:hypothetical protein